MGDISTLVLVPQAVEAVRPLPVLAAGGIADGRTFAAALLLGATGANVGTRFLAAEEAGIPQAWQQRIVGAASDEAVRVEFAESVFPPAAPAGFLTRPRVLLTDYVTTWNARFREPTGDAEAAADLLAAAARAEMTTALGDGRAHELVPFTGQSAGLIRGVLPAAQIVQELVADAEQVLRSAPQLAQ